MPTLLIHKKPKGQYIAWLTFKHDMHQVKLMHMQCARITHTTLRTPLAYYVTLTVTIGRCSHPTNDLWKGPCHKANIRGNFLGLLLYSFWCTYIHRTMHQHLILNQMFQNLHKGGWHVSNSFIFLIQHFRIALWSFSLERGYKFYTNFSFCAFTLMFTVCTDTSEEFWDYEHQVDLEAFNSNTFYTLLLKQSLAVTTQLGLFTTEVCS